MKCNDCCMWWADEKIGHPSCHADPNWPAPCEYEDCEPDVLDDLNSYDYGDNLI